MNISRSQIAPHINIHYENPHRYMQAESALRMINHGVVGRKLIEEIKNFSTEGKALSIEVNNQLMTAAYPMLTESQIKKFGVSASDFNEEHNEVANALANKKRFGRKGEGTSSIIKWNPSVALHVKSNGKIIGTNDERESFISLAHEMIHSYRMMKGTYLVDGSDRYNEGTNSAEEEARAVGLGKHANHEITENKIRVEHGFQQRMKYQLDENDITIGI
ncbi:hypothetical protein F3J37_01680 [Pantoea sp. Al-1710]|uniref:Uncharacterized protein n=1 Tax=Candidatus Pantoea communis TaxID=2608354 RepID=A0ABX0RJV5_9GAMM|nr:MULTISPECIES: XopG/HopH/AvrPtoH family type III secretion system effector [Pantoea]NIG12910.1 hypothetical protein [Pantoea sp. Cy-640]NIG17389.1 hypothetical protein [Pantoea communis]